MSQPLKNWISALLLALLVSGCAVTPREGADAGAAGPFDSADAAAFDAAVQQLRAERYEQAAAALRKLTERRPQYSGPWANLGIALARLGRDGEAAQALQQALALKALPAVHNELGMLHRRAGRFAEARQAYEAALAAAPDFALAHRNLGMLCDLYLYDLDCALTHYQAYGRLAPAGDKEIELWLADLQQRLASDR